MSLVNLSACLFSLFPPFSCKQDQDATGSRARTDQRPWGLAFFPLPPSPFLLRPGLRQQGLADAESPFSFSPSRDLYEVHSRLELPPPPLPFFLLSLEIHTITADEWLVPFPSPPEGRGGGIKMRANGSPFVFSPFLPLSNGAEHEYGKKNMDSRLKRFPTSTGFLPFPFFFFFLGEEERKRSSGEGGKNAQSSFGYLWRAFVFPFFSPLEGSGERIMNWDTAAVDAFQCTSPLFFPQWDF